MTPINNLNFLGMPFSYMKLLIGGKSKFSFSSSLRHRQRRKKRSASIRIELRIRLTLLSIRTCTWHKSRYHLPCDKKLGQLCGIAAFFMVNYDSRRLILVALLTFSQSLGSLMSLQLQHAKFFMQTMKILIFLVCILGFSKQHYHHAIQPSIVLEENVIVQMRASTNLRQ